LEPKEASHVFVVLAAVDDVIRRKGPDMRFALPPSVTQIVQLARHRVRA
jgi:hypothetical protein